MSTKARAQQGSQPVIDEKYLDYPSQRLYSLSLGLLCQVRCHFRPSYVQHPYGYNPKAIKAFDFVQLLFSPHPSGTTHLRKWILADALYVLGLASLRIPRLNYSKAMVALQLLLLCLLDSLLFGGIRLGMAGSMPGPGTTIASALNAYLIHPTHANVMCSRKR
jgi:nucleoporin POM152